MIASSPSLFRAWRFGASSAHPREAESDSFLACAAKTTEACGDAHATMHAVALIYTPRCLSAGCGMRCCAIPIGKKTLTIRTYVIRGFRIGRNIMQCTLRVIPEGIPGSRCIVIMVYPYPGYCATVLQKSHKFRVRVWGSYRSSGYGYESVTEITEVPGIVKQACRTHRSSGQV